MRHGMWPHANSESPRQSSSLRLCFSEDKHRNKQFTKCTKTQHKYDTAVPEHVNVTEWIKSHVTPGKLLCSRAGKVAGSLVLGWLWYRQSQHAGSPLQLGAAWGSSSLYNTERLLPTVLKPQCRGRCWSKASWLVTESVMSLMSPWGWGSDPLTHTQFWSVHSKARRRQWHIC